MTDDIADDMQAAVEQLGSETPEAPVETPSEPPEPSTPSAPDAGAEAPDAEAKAKPDGRESNGRFAKKDKAAPIVTTKPTLVKPLGAAPAASGDAAPSPSVRPPQDLKPAEREAFKTWPKEAQEAFVRRSRESAVGMQRLAEPARFGQQVQQVLAPFASHIQAAGGDTLQTMSNAMRTAHVLNNGSSLQRAQTVASLISQFLPDEEGFKALNAILQGQPAPTQQPQGGGFDQNSMAQFLRSQGFVTRTELQQQRMSGLASEADQEVSNFADTHEFFEDVKPRMRALLKSYAEEGLELDMEEAYDLACSRDAGISSILEQRNRAEQAKASTASTQRARAAGGTMRTQPSGPVSAPNVSDDIGADLLAAVNSFRR